MTISGYEWMVLITAASLCASVGVAGVGFVLVEKLKRLCAVKSSGMRLAAMGPAAMGPAVVAPAVNSPVAPAMNAPITRAAMSPAVARAA
jgi:hypothetical protein